MQGYERVYVGKRVWKLCFDSLYRGFVVCGVASAPKITARHRDYEQPNITTPVVDSYARPTEHAHRQTTSARAERVIFGQSWICSLFRYVTAFSVAVRQKEYQHLVRHTAG